MMIHATDVPAGSVKPEPSARTIVVCALVSPSPPSLTVEAAPVSREVGTVNPYYLLAAGQPDPLRSSERRTP